MTIRFQCPSCKTAINAPDHAGGHTASCPSCHAKIGVPVPTGELLPAFAPAAEEPAPKRAERSDFQRAFSWGIGLIAAILIIPCGLCVGPAFLGYLGEPAETKWITIEEREVEPTARTWPFACPACGHGFQRPDGATAVTCPSCGAAWKQPRAGGGWVRER